MNNINNQLYDLLDELKEKYNIVGVKSEFETEGASFEETNILREITKDIGLNLTIKIGGCEAINDICYAKKIKADTIVAPMIESEYAMEKFINAVKQVFSPNEINNINFLINIETITGYMNFNNIIQNQNFTFLNGCVLGRTDMLNSLKLYNNSDENKILEIALDMSEQIEKYNKKYIIGGNITPQSVYFLQKIPFLTNFETRKIIFDSKFLYNKNVEEAIIKAIEFEITWLECKNNHDNKTQNRILKLENLIKQRV